MTTPIKPRVRPDGVPMCSELCEDRTCHDYESRGYGCCIPAVRDLAAEVAAWRAFYYEKPTGKEADALEDAMERTGAWRKPCR